MEEREVRDLLKRMLTDLDPAFGYEVHHQKFTADMPQSGERLSRDNLRAMQENYPNPPTFQLRRVVGAGDVWVVEALGDYSGKLYHMVMIVEFRDSKIWKETRYYALPAPRRGSGSRAPPQGDPQTGDCERFDGR